MIHNLVIISSVLLLLVLTPAALPNKVFAATYQNVRQGYSITYPDDWTVRESTKFLPTAVFTPKQDSDPCKCTILLVEARSGYNFTDAITAEKGNITAFVLGPVVREGIIKLPNGLPGYVLVSQLRDAGSVWIRIVTANNDTQYTLTTDGHATTQLQTILKMVNSFQVTNSSKS